MAKKPIEFKVIFRKTGEPASEFVADADALLFIRTFVDGEEGGEGKITHHVGSVEGWSGESISLDAMFMKWLALAGHIARAEAKTPQEQTYKEFTTKILGHVRLNAYMQGLKD